MNIRDSLKADFGIDVLVDRGSGLRDDPYRIEPCSKFDATRTQLDLLRGLGIGRGELWKLLTSEVAHEIGSAIQRLRIKSIRFTEHQIITETRAYYFDVSQVDGLPIASSPLIEWTDPRTRFSAPFQISWLHYDRATNNAPDRADLDTTIYYSSFGAKASIYLYGSVENFSLDVVGYELAKVCNQVRAMHPDAKAPWPTCVIEPFVLQHFLMGKDMSIAAVAILGRYFLKLRLTHFDDLKMRDLMHDAVRELGRLALNSQADA